MFLPLCGLPIHFSITSFEIFDFDLDKAQFATLFFYDLFCAYIPIKSYLLMTRSQKYSFLFSSIKVVVLAVKLMPNIYLKGILNFLSFNSSVCI